MRKERWREGKRTRANKNERQECFFPRRERLRGLEREFKQSTEREGEVDNNKELVIVQVFAKSFGRISKE